MIFLKSSKQLKKMKQACQLTTQVLKRMGELVRPGVTTREIDALGVELCKEAGAKPLFLHYPGSSGQPPFPGVICASPNEVVVHGIPDDEPLKEGDILSVDFGCKLDGYCGDQAFTFCAGEISAEAQALLEVTYGSLRLGIEAATPGNCIGDIAWAIQSHVEANGCGVVRTLVGHGIGRAMHEDPQVPNFGDPGTGDVIRPGMTLAIEPMITQGNYEVETGEDKWTVRTKDRSLAAHFEHTVAVLSDGPEILTGVIDA